jgi:hypothetical protein
MAGRPAGSMGAASTHRRSPLMLQKLSDHVAECIARAADTERRAQEATDSQLRADLFDIARRWRHLAESYQFVESLDRFIVEQKSQRLQKSA